MKSNLVVEINLYFKTSPIILPVIYCDKLTNCAYCFLLKLLCNLLSCKLIKIIGGIFEMPSLFFELTKLFVFN